MNSTHSSASRVFRILPVCDPRSVGQLWQIRLRGFGSAKAAGNRRMHPQHKSQRRWSAESSIRTHCAPTL